MIITNKHGRKKSILTHREIDGRVGEVVSLLTDEEKDLFFGLLQDEIDNRKEIEESMLDHRYHTRPVSMEQFLEDPYYLGESCSTLYPVLKKDLIELFDYPHREVLITGGIGVGKSFVASIIVCRTLYELSCYISPQKTFGLSSGSELVVVLYSKNLELTRNVMKTAIDDKLKESIYFIEKFTPKFSKNDTVFPNNIKMIVSSYGAERVLGTNVVSSWMDEMNFPPKRKDQQITTAIGERKKAAHFDPVEKVYRTLVRRIESRFLKSTAGDFPGMVILTSSASTLESFTERKVKESKDDPGVFIRDHTRWTAKPDEFCGEKFWVLCSTSSMRSRILKEEEYDLIDDEWLDENDAWLIDVPIEYKGDFETDIENAMRDIAGISTQAISAYIQRIEAVDMCADSSIPHVFSMGEWTAGGPGRFLLNKMCRKFERKLQGGFIEDAYAPIVNPKKLRWCHVDTSLSGDSTGFCVGHIDKFVEVVRRGGDGYRYTDVAPSYYIDIILRINPPRGESIHLPDIRRLIYELMRYGYNFIGVSTDTFQYAEFRDKIKERGIHYELVSMDRTTDAYDELKRAIYENRIRYHPYEPFIEELKALEYDREKGKIEHPTAGSKDLSDAVAGVLISLLRRSSHLPIGSDNDTHRITGQKDEWVSPLVPMKDVDMSELKELVEEEMGADDEYVSPIIFGD